MTDHAEWWTFAANAQVEEPVAQAVPILRLAISLSMPFSMMAHASIHQQAILCDCATDIPHVATLGASQSSSTSTPATGTLTTVDITVIWTNSAGDGSWAGDLLMEIGAPMARALALADTTSEQDARWALSHGHQLGMLLLQAHTRILVDLTSFNMTGDGDWTLNLINGWASSGGAITTPL